MVERHELDRAELWPSCTTSRVWLMERSDVEAAIDLNQDGQLEIVYRRTYMQAWGGGLATYQGARLVPLHEFLCKRA